MKKITLMVVCLVAMFALVGCASSTSPVVEVGGDSVPSLYAAAGEKKIVGTSSSIKDGVSQKVLTYGSGTVTQEDMQQYIDMLVQDGFYQISDTVSEGTAQKLDMARESVEQGNLVVVSITFDATGSTELAYMVGEGTLTPHEDTLGASEADV